MVVAVGCWLLMLFLLFSIACGVIMYYDVGLLPK